MRIQGPEKVRARVASSEPGLRADHPGWLAALKDQISSARRRAAVRAILRRDVSRFPNSSTDCRSIAAWMVKHG